ncbi:MAG TPA: hypothetical protein VHW09_10925 [Bryobacteraceae bacterium]|jgi:hypothetical protein|nr:hypothetical protein [Bryobacteraceae bacterium]
MGFGVVFGSFTRVVRRVQTVPVRYMGVMRGLFVVTFFVMFGSFVVVGGRMLVMFSSLLMVFCSFVAHGYPLSWRLLARPGLRCESARDSKGILDGHRSQFDESTEPSEKPGYFVVSRPPPMNES